jgi:hypothetical protein
MARPWVLLPLLAVPVLAFDGPPPPAARPAVRTATPPGTSWEQADSLARKILALEKRRVERSTKKETILVTEAELNSYLTLTYAPRMPKGVTGVSVRLDQDRIEAQGVVDLEQVGAKPQQEKSRFSLMSLLAPTVPVLLRGKLINQNGFGTLQWEEVRLSSLPLPLTALAQMVATATRSPKYPNGWDIEAPFRLPYAARRVRLEPGRVFLDF